MREREMIEIALRVPQETVRTLLSAAAEALTGAEGRAPIAAENGGFQEAAFRRLSRAEDEPEDGTASGPRGPYSRRAGRQSGEGAEGPSPVEPGFSAQGGVSPERGLRGAEEAPVRRGSGTAGRRLSAPEPASYAVERTLPAAERTLPAEKGPAEWESGSAAGPVERPAGPEKESAERGAGLSPKALSDRWERDSRRYDGGFTLY
ncbi:MAG: hypothetical protein HFF61_02695 [Oscillospiraceae bacterium]|nr:hypothetical protein [Oscillospiraceae bacterium]